MGKLILCCAAVALRLQAQAQSPAVTGVANDPPTSPTLRPGSIGSVFGSNFGTVENTTITVGGLNAQVLAVSSNQIRALFPANLPAGLTALTVAVDGKASEPVNVIVSPSAPGRTSSGKGSVSAGPAFPFSPPHWRETPLAPPSLPGPMDAATPAGGGIVYTCDATVTAASATACNTLNTTIAALYSGAFTNANASIYVKLGSATLGLSDWVINDAGYSSFRSLLIASESDANDITAVTDSVPAVNPYGSDAVELPNALGRALGFGSPSFGFEANGMTFCNLGTPGCYDGVITISNTAPLYFRTGSISSNQYDFFTAVEHETDEILGTASCVFCGSGAVLPADYFRYHSNGTRSLAAGTNDSCSSSDSTNACFSLDGVHMLQRYNNLSGGGDAGDWVTNCASPLVQDAAICAGIAGVDISPAAEILVLDVVGYTLVGSSISGSVTNVTSSAPNGTYGIGSSISIQIAFSEAVTVTGAPQLALNSGGTASYSSGSGTNTLTFIYVVAAGQNSALLDYVSTGSLTLNGGSIKGPGGKAENLALAAPGAPGSLSYATDIVINTRLASQTITFGALSNVTLGVAPFTIGATASSGLPVSFTSATPAVCTVSGSTVAIAARGTCSITASQAGNASYLPATPVTQNFTVTGGKPSEVGIFRENFEFILDANGNRQFDGTGPGQDIVINNFVPALSGDVPVAGDWSGSGTTKIGIYRSSNGQWFLDYNGDGVFDAGDKVYSFGGIPGDVPVVGDWSGSGFSKIGIFRSGFFWILDFNGDGSFDAGDQAFSFGGIAGDVPVAGDWTGDGKAKVGVVRPFVMGGTPAFWILDANNDHAVDAGDLIYAFGGISGDLPVVGDWNGSGTSKSGVLRLGFFWVVDNNGSAAVTLGSSQLAAFPFGGIAGDVPLTGKW